MKLLQAVKESWYKQRGHWWERRVTRNNGTPKEPDSPPQPKSRRNGFQGQLISSLSCLEFYTQAGARTWRARRGFFFNRCPWSASHRFEGITCVSDLWQGGDPVRLALLT